MLSGAQWSHPSPEASPLSSHDWNQAHRFTLNVSIKKKEKRNLCHDCDVCLTLKIGADDILRANSVFVLPALSESCHFIVLSCVEIDVRGGVYVV